MMSDIDDMPKKQNDECSNESSSHKNSTAAGGPQHEGSTKDAQPLSSSPSSSPPPPPPRRRLLEEQHAISMLQLLLDRGYFHEKDNADTIKESTATKEAADGHASVEVKEYNPSEATLLETTTTSGGTVFCTLNHLHAQLKKILQQRKCCTLAIATQLLGLMDNEQIHRIIHHQQQKQQNDDENDTDDWILLVGDQIITDAHLNDVALWLQQALMEKGNKQQEEKSSGAAAAYSSSLWISMADVAREWKWTGGVEDVVRLLVSSRSCNKFLEPLHIMHLTRDNGMRVFMLRAHYANLQEQLQETLQSATRPMSITKLCQENKHWEKSWIDSFINKSSKDTDNDANNDWVAKLDGDWHNGGETYIPHVYTRMQQGDVVDTLLHQTGLVLVQDLCATVDIRPNQVQSYINQAMIDTQNNDFIQNNDIIFLQECIVNLNIIVPPIETLVQDAVTNKTWCELDLPIQLLSSKEMIDDAKMLLTRHVVLKMNKASNDNNNNNVTEGDAGGGCGGGGGVVAVTMEGGLFASRYFVLDLETNHVRPLIPRLAQAQAKRDWAKRQQQQQQQKATNAMTPTTTSATTAHSLLSMEILTETVTRACPDLARFAEENASLVQELCKCAFWDDNNNAQLSKLCQQAMQDEFVRLEKHAAALAKSKTNTSANNSEGGGGGGGGTIVAHHTTAEVSFEDASCFAAACYLLQAMAKFIDYAESRLKKDDDDDDDDDDDNNVTMELLRQAFFQGACADFTRRMTQFCLHKFNMDDDDSDNDNETDGHRENAAAIPHFSFEPKTDDIVSDIAATKQPSFCSPIDIAMRRYPYKTYLSCSMVNGHDGNAAADDSKREPLAVLRTVLPRNVGQALARQWTLCGKACYETSTASGDYDDIDSLEEEDDAVAGGEASRDSSVVAFLSHVEEHCLTICGIPFKKLDKKSEKSFLAARKQRLVQSLQTATDPKDVLEWTVMILYQSVKNQTVFDHNHIHGNNMEQHQSLLCGPILQLLIQERKISPAVAKVLTDLADGILNAKDGNVDVDNALVERVRACGLCKDIAKHVVVVEE